MSGHESLTYSLTHCISSPSSGSLVLLELLALSLPYFLSYGYARMTASKYFSDKDIKLIAPIESSLWFYLHVWSIWDVKGVLTLGKDSGCGNTNTLPLLNNQDFK